MSFLEKTYWAYRNKITNKLWGIVYMRATEKKKGIILISYITEPFTLAPWEKFSNYHTMYWECYEIARLFSEMGYAIDIINAKDKSFIPKKPYTVCIDTENNLERLAQHLPRNCKKVFHILISHWETYNKAEEERLKRLEQRRGVCLSARRKMNSSKNAEIADYLEGFGNETVFKSFSKFKKPIFFIPISVVKEYSFPENKNFVKARRHFLWFGGGGAVLKGLDITLEAFSTMPDLHLHVCGPIHGEQDFVNEYHKELYETPNIHVYGRINIGSKQFKELINTCGVVVYPSGGEGSSGAIVQTMHAGLVPIITHETGIKENSGYIPLENPTPASIAQVVKNFSEKSPKEIEGLSRKIWEYARKQYTRKTFSDTYNRFIKETLNI